MVLPHRLQLAHIGHHLAAHPPPAHRFGFFSAFAANVDDVVLDGLRTERARFRSFSFGFVRTDWIRSIKVEACLEERFKHSDPRFVFAVMEGKSKDPAGPQNSVRLAPTLRSSEKRGDGK